MGYGEMILEKLVCGVNCGVDFWIWRDDFGKTWGKKLIIKRFILFFGYVLFRGEKWVKFAI